MGWTTNLNWLATFLPSTVCKSCPSTAPPEWQLRQCYRGSLGEALWSGPEGRMVRIDGGIWIWTRCFNGSERQIQLAGGKLFGCLVLMLMVLMFLGQLWVVEMIMLEHPTETQGQNCIVHTRKENTALWEKPPPWFGNDILLIEELHVFAWFFVLLNLQNYRLFNFPLQPN